VVTYIEVKKDKTDEAFVSGFITFIYVDENTKPVAHNIDIVAVTDEDKALQEKAKNLKNK
jgi:hypothetical protein